MEEIFRQSISKKLKSLLVEKGINETMIASATGISQSAVNRIKNGSVVPSLYHAKKICDYLGISLDELAKEDLKIFNSDQKNYVPILNANDLITQKQQTILGFHSLEDTENQPSLVGFKVDKSFDSYIFKNNSIVITDLSDNDDLQDNQTILFIYNRKFIVGNYNKKLISPIDKLSLQLNANDILIIGKIITIETRFIKEKSMVERIINSIGQKRLGAIAPLLDKKIAII